MEAGGFGHNGVGYHRAMDRALALLTQFEIEFEEIPATDGACPVCGRLTGDTSAAA